MEKQSRREFASADATAGVQDATLQERRLGAEIPLDPCRRVGALWALAIIVVLGLVGLAIHAGYFAGAK